MYYHQNTKSQELNRMAINLNFAIQEFFIMKMAIILYFAIHEYFIMKISKRNVKFRKFNKLQKAIKSLL